MFKRVYLTFCAVLFAVVLYFAFITFKPINKVYIKDTTRVIGVVSAISLGNGGDIYVSLKEDTHNYYINRATQLGFDLNELQELILEKEIRLWHIKRWTPFTRDKVFPHISRITYKDSIIFDEIIENNDKK